MKKLFVLFLLTLLLTVASAPVFAGGDQVQGEKSTGPSYQYGITSAFDSEIETEGYMVNAD